MGEIDSGVEDSAALVFRVIDRTAAQNAHLDAVVEQGQIGSSFKVGGGAVAFGIEETRISQGDVPYAALALHPRLAEIDRFRFLKFRKLLDRLPFWPEHGVNEME